MAISEELTEPREIAEDAGLRYVSDIKPGFTRKKHGKDFDYFDTHDAKITDEKIVARVKSIGVPPAYENVWICPQANGHIQATGLERVAASNIVIIPNGGPHAMKTNSSIFYISAI